LADGENGEQSSTKVTFKFSAPVELGIGDLLVGKAGDTGSVTPGDLTGGIDGKTWTLAIEEVTAGNVTVKVNLEGVEKAEKLVAIFQEGLLVNIGYEARSNGSPSARTSQIAFLFNTQIDLNGVRVTIGKEGDEGRAMPRALTGQGDTWVLSVEVTKTGSVTLRINKRGIDHETVVMVYEGIGYSVHADGEAGKKTSSVITLYFDAPVSGLLPGDITLGGGPGSARKGNLSALLSNVYELAIDQVIAGEISLVIAGKSTISRTPRSVTLFKGPVSYTVVQTGGGNGRADSAALEFIFDEDIDDLRETDIAVTGGGGRVSAGSLSGGGKIWTLSLAGVTKPGLIELAIHKSGVEEGTKTMAVYKAGEMADPVFTAHSINAYPAGFRTSSVAVGNGVFVVGGTNGELAYSADGADWKPASDSPIAVGGGNRIARLLWHGTNFVAAPLYGNWTYSPDGAHWGSTGMQGQCRAMFLYKSSSYYAYDIVAIVDGMGEGSLFVWSEDLGETWHNTPASLAIAPPHGTSGMAYGGDSRVVFVGSGGMILHAASFLALNHQDVIWENGESAFGNSDINAVVWGGDKFVAVGNGGRMAYSLDGINWAKITDNDAVGDSGVNYEHIAWGGGIFIAASNGESGGLKIVWSADGLDWAPLNPAADGFEPGDYIVDISYGDRWFVIAGDSAANSTVWSYEVE
jgi:hypothetical protein